MIIWWFLLCVVAHMYKINSVDKIRVGGRATTTVVRHKYSIRIFIRHHGGGPTTHSIDLYRLSYTLYFYVCRQSYYITVVRSSTVDDESFKEIFFKMTISIFVVTSVSGRFHRASWNASCSIAIYFLHEKFQNDRVTEK